MHIAQLTKIHKIESSFERWFCYPSENLKNLAIIFCPETQLSRIKSTAGSPWLIV